MRILIADGSPLIHERISALVAGLPDQTIVGCAVDAERTEVLAAAHVPDVVLIDASLPDGGCLRLLQWIAARPRATRPVAIVLASPASEPYRRHLREAGAAFVFDKLSDLDQLAAVISSTEPELAV